MKTRTAPEGFWLTQASLQDEDSRIFVKEVSGYGDIDALYTLWSDEQKAAWEDEHPQPVEE